MLISYFACTHVNWVLSIMVARNASIEPTLASQIGSLNSKDDLGEVLDNLDAAHSSVKVPPDSLNSLLHSLNAYNSPSQALRGDSDSNIRIDLKATAGSSSDVYVKIRNTYDYYIVVKAFLLEEDRQTDKTICRKNNLHRQNERLGGFFLEKCMDKNNIDNPCPGPFFIDNAFTVIMPGENAIIGKLVFAPTALGVFHAQLYVKTATKVISRIEISGTASGGTFDLFHDSMLNSEINSIKISSETDTNLVNIHLKNSGTTEEHIKGIYFPGFVCSYNSLTIKNCDAPLLIRPDEEVLLTIEEKFDYVQYAYTTELWLHSESRIYVYNLSLEIIHEVPAETSGIYSILYVISLLFFMNSLKNINTFEVTRTVSIIPYETSEFEWTKKLYKRPVYKNNAKQEKFEAPIVKDKEKIRYQISLSPQLMINVSKLKNFDEFALASVTTDTRIHSPANTHTDEESEEELYLDMYKVTGIFSLSSEPFRVNRIC